MKNRYRILAAAAVVATGSAIVLATQAAQAQAPVLGGGAHSAVADSSCRLDAVAPAPTGRDSRWVDMWRSNPASQKPATARALTAPDAVTAAQAVPGAGGRAGLKVAGSPAAAAQMSYARAAASTGDDVAEGIVAPDRCVWLVTVKAAFTPRSVPYGAKPVQYDSYTTVFDAATGQFLSITAGPAAPDVLSGANIAS
ncbi:hypothetical protein ACQP2F_31815 [Actinoplanes sp. CA-030573]|uniref:hypothetical protein n=1 Tax=Actinoplanes sp. CA-030573 TaxID=3239898 RepID=UPI003D8F3B29